MQTEIAQQESTQVRTSRVKEIAEWIASARQRLTADPDEARSLVLQAKDAILESQYFKLFKRSEKETFKNPELAAKRELAHCYDILARADYQQNNSSGALENISHALRLFKECRDKKNTAEALNFNGNILQMQGKVGDAITFYQAAFGVRQEVGDIEGCSGSMINLSYMYTQKGEIIRGLDYALEGVEMARRSETKRFLGNGLTSLGNLYLRLGSYIVAIDYYRQALAVYEREGRRKEQGTAHLNIGSVFLLMDEKVQALENLLKAMAIYEEVGNVVGVQQTCSNLGSLYQISGRLDEAVSFFKRSLAISEDTGDEFNSMQVKISLAGLYNEEGHYAEAVQLLKEVLAQAKPKKLFALHAACLLNLGQVYLAEPQLGDAEESLLKAVGIFSEIHEFPKVREAHSALAAYYQHNGDFKKAFEQLLAQQKVDADIVAKDNVKKLHDLQLAHEIEKTKQEAEILRLKTEKLEMERDFEKRRLTQLAAQMQSKQQSFSFIKKLAEELRISVDSQHARQLLKEISREASQHTGDSLNVWPHFEEHFERLHPDYITNLLKTAPGLSPAEQRVCALIRMDMSSKDIASTLHVTEKTIEVHRTNIRRKLQLGPKDNLPNFLKQL
jgi:tetratricopeptide (TPR) repeat protein